MYDLLRRDGKREGDIMTLTPNQKVALIQELTSVKNDPILNYLIRHLINQAESLSDIHYGLSACSLVLKAANQRVVEMMGD